MLKPFKSWTLKNENAILSIIGERGFKTVEAEVNRHIEENADGTITKALWIDVKRYLDLLKNPLAFPLKEFPE